MKLILIILISMAFYPTAYAFEFELSVEDKLSDNTCHLAVMSRSKGKAGCALEGTTFELGTNLVGGINLFIDGEVYLQVGRYEQKGVFELPVSRLISYRSLFLSPPLSKKPIDDVIAEKLDGYIFRYTKH